MLPRYFCAIKIKSFLRQLNIYDFQRMPDMWGGASSSGCGAIAYKHASFLRGNPMLCFRMVRTKVKRTSSEMPWQYVTPLPKATRITACGGDEDIVATKNPELQRQQGKDQQHAEGFDKTPWKNLSPKGPGKMPWKNLSPVKNETRIVSCDEEMQQHELGNSRDIAARTLASLPFYDNDRASCTSRRRSSIALSQASLEPLQPQDEAFLDFDSNLFLPLLVNYDDAVVEEQKQGNYQTPMMDFSARAEEQHGFGHMLEDSAGGMNSNHAGLHGDNKLSNSSRDYCLLLSSFLQTRGATSSSNASLSRSINLCRQGEILNDAVERIPDPPMVSSSRFGL
jgi:hypothetical protein